MHLFYSSILFTAAAVQIHFTGQNHWVTSAFDGKEVRLYDSLVSGRCPVTSSLEEQLVQIYQVAVDNGLLTIRRMAVQQQEGAADCGLFSIAYAYHAARGDDVSQLHFHQAAMREHLVTCFEQEELSPFPLAEHTARRVVCRSKHLFVHTYCVCGMPESFDSEMVQCEVCEGWFHFKCMHIRTAPEHWSCNTCNK